MNTNPTTSERPGTVEHPVVPPQPTTGSNVSPVATVQMPPVQAPPTRVAPTAAPPVPRVGGAPPTTATPAAPAKPASPRRKFALIAVVALLVGAGIGYAASMPGTSSVTDERDAAVAQADELNDEVDAAQADVAAKQTELENAQAELSSVKSDLAVVEENLATAEADLATATAALDTANADLTATQGDLADMTENRDVCATATATGQELVTAWETQFANFIAWLPTAVGSPEEAQLEEAINEQFVLIDTLTAEFDAQTAACAAG